MLDPDQQIQGTVRLLFETFRRTGQQFRRLTVRYLRTTHGIEGPGAQLRRAGWLTIAEIATQLRIHRSTAKRFGREGVLRAARVDDKGGMLFEPPSGALPRAHPGKRFRDRRRYAQRAPHVRKEVQYAD